MARRVPAELTTLRFGDVAIVGHGPDGPITIGVERKRITDLWGSLTSGRLAGHQLTGLIDEYRYRWLLVEGPYREREDGLIEVPQGRGEWRRLSVLALDLEAWLLTLQLRGGLALWRTWDVHETVRFIAALHQWWTKPWDEHAGHLALHTPPDSAILTRPKLIVRVAAELPGIGYKKAHRVSRKFQTVQEMANAEEGTWQEIDGIGPTISRAVTLAIQRGIE
jgi:ERCC4-type nuclease